MSYVLSKKTKLIETTKWLKTACNDGFAVVFIDTGYGSVVIYEGFLDNVQEMFGRTNIVLFRMIYEVASGKSSIADFVKLVGNRVVLTEENKSGIYLRGVTLNTPKEVVFDIVWKCFVDIIAEANAPLQALADLSHEPS